MKYLTGRPKGHAAYRPQAAARELIQRVGTILEQYEEHLPLTLRQLFYRLVATCGYEKTEEAYHSLSNCLCRARRAGLVPWEAIRDDGWTPPKSLGWDGPSDFWGAVLRTAQKYRRDRTDGQEFQVILLVEAAGMIPQARRVADIYSVGVAGSGGFDSLTAKKMLADIALESERPTVFLHAGDYDPSGVCIFDAAEADVLAFVNDPERAIFHRIALTEEQIERYSLPTAPPKSSDKRGGRMSETCQLESLPPDVLAEVFKSAILTYYNVSVYQRVLDEEDQERKALVKAAERVKAMVD